MTSSTPQQRRWTEQAVADLRQKLLDLSKKNPLIAFKHTTRGASHVRIIDERPDLLFETLSQESMGFEPLPGEDRVPADENTGDFQIAYERARLTDPEFLAATDKIGDSEEDAARLQQAERQLRARVRHLLGLPPLEQGKTIDVHALAKAHGFDPSYDLGRSDDDTDKHHEDDMIRVLLTAKELEKRLKGVWGKYRTHERETGLHTLYMIFGFVQWFEDDTSSTAFHAPLLLLPVQMEQAVKRGRYEYRLRAMDEGLQINVALAEKMRQHFGLELPQLRTDELPESYFIRVEKVLEQGRTLSLRRFATLAVLPFPRMVLWQDLDPEQWDDGAFADHELLPVLMSAKGGSDGPEWGEVHDIDVAPWAKKAPPLVKPADASQHSALIDVMDGKSLAIEGPPGTGKSQTITNMIAAAVREGKTVLFVAEKQAALSVVSKRLREVGFGPLLLEMHSDNANRTAIYDGIRERLAAKVRTDDALLDTKRSDLVRQRDLIRNYLSLIATRLGKLGRPTYNLVWREIALRRRVDRGGADIVQSLWQPNEPKEISRSDVQDVRQKLENFAKSWMALQADVEKYGPTSWTLASRLSAFDQSVELQLAQRCADAAIEIHGLNEALNAVAEIEFPKPVDASMAPVEQLEGIEPFSGVEEHVVRAALIAPDAARALLARQTRWRQLKDKLANDIAAPEAVTAPSVAELAKAIVCVSPLPTTTQAVTEQLSAAATALAEDRAIDTDRADIVSRLKVSDDLTVAEFGDAVRAIADLDHIDPIVRAAMDEKLLDPLAKIVLAEERERAERLSSERSEAIGNSSAELAEVTPKELSEHSKTIGETGFFGRLFSGQYKKSKAFCREHGVAISDRADASKFLRRASKLFRDIENFRQSSPVVGTLPPLLWKGVDTDWQAADECSALLERTQKTLEKVRLSSALPLWLAAHHADRAKICAIAARLIQIVETKSTLGLASLTISEASAKLDEKHAQLKNLRDCLGAVNALPDGQLVRDGEALPDRIGALQQTRDDFDAIRQSEHFDWVTDIAASVEVIALALKQVDQIDEVVGPIPINAVLRSTQEPAATLARLLALREQYGDVMERWLDARDAIEDRTGIELETVLSANSWPELVDALKDMAGDEDGARLSANLLVYRNDVESVGCDALAHAAMRGQIPAAQLADLYEMLVVRALINSYIGGDGAALGRMGSLTLEAARQSFAAIDEELHELEARAIVSKSLKSVAPRGVTYGPTGQLTNMGLIDHELGLKRPRLPIRDLVHRAGPALSVMKPVWMMSPSSAAQFIRPGTLKFDLLVVDEASQMRPEFAVSAIMRGEQFVVVGDANQLPPTDFFSLNSDSDDDDEGEEEEKMKIGNESILDLANQRFQNKRRLQWHYRSQHESLIQFSNREFYDRKLVVFPSPSTDHDLLGVHHFYVGGTYEASINQQEAERIIEEAFRLMQIHPTLSIGIATMNAKQTELIRNEFDRLILTAPAIRTYVDAFNGTPDEFFIKNLENVQGDERDIILISTVYGPNKEKVVNQRFGPMNREVGWRRLNVLVTRARLSTRIFTSLHPEDIKITEKSSRGMQAFKAYLTYAQRGALYDDDTGGEPDSDFEIFVADAIRGAGYDVTYQVGVEGFRIDLGVKHPDYPLGFIAGIECDGATYHSGMTIRDRDRIRQSVLEGLGWTIYRIWSTDWFADPGRETAKLIAQLDTWREAKAEEYELQQASNEQIDPGSDITDKDAVVDAITLVADETTLIDKTLAPSLPVANGEPEGKPMRPVDDKIEWYEVVPKTRYAVWGDGTQIGTIEVIARATGAAHLYGSQTYIPRTEYECLVEGTGARFIVHDIYVAVREVARRASQQEEE